MCGRFSLTVPPEILAEHFGLADVTPLRPRYNIAPSQEVVAILDQDRWTMARLRWGLVPSWVKDPATASRWINARQETAAQKPAFRRAFAHRRCLIPADGFYEWKKTKGRKQPYYYRLRDGRPFAFAGLWERQTGKDGADPLYTCTILTTEANELVQDVHPRMPAILSPDHFGQWLDPDQSDPRVLLPLLQQAQPSDLAQLEVHPVGTWVNNAAVDDPRCIEPVTADAEGEAEKEERNVPVQGELF